MSDEVLVKAEGVSKKFCRSLKRSLWYGVQDVSAEMFGRTGSHNELRKNEFWAVDDVSFELKRGECLGLIGPNGAGKSTLLKMLNGLVKPDKGRITMRGRVGALIELGAGFNPILTARENIYVNGSVLGFTKRELDHKFDAIVDFAEIDEFIDTPVQNFSSGMKVRLGFAVASQLDPDVLLIDEVLAVGDAKFTFKCINRISQLSKSTSVIFVSHSMLMVSRMSSLAMSIDKGRVEYFGSETAQAIEKYLSAVELVAKDPERSDYFSLRAFSFSGKSQVVPSGDYTVRFRDPIQISVEFAVKKAAPACYVNLVFMDMEGKAVAQCLSSRDRVRYSAEGPRLAVKMDLDSLPLNPGRYSLHLGLIEALPGNQCGEILYQNTFVAGLVVNEGVLSWAPVQFATTWGGSKV